MKDHRTDELFGLVRQVPTELSTESVLAMIKTIPPVPPAKPWFKNFNLNSIIMTTTAITIVGSALMFFLTSGDPTTDIAKSPVEEPEETLVHKIDTSQQEAVQETSRIKEGTDKTGLAEKQSTPPIQTPPQNKEVQDAATEINPKTQPAEEPAVQQANPEEETEAMAAEDEVFLESPSEGEASRPRIPWNKLRQLKREFIRSVKKDNLSVGKKQLNVLSYTNDGIIINGKQLEGSMLERYTELMAKYEITPGQFKKVVTHPDYIQVGDFTEEGLKGQAIGRNMDVKFWDPRVKENDILNRMPADSISYIPRPTIFSKSSDDSLRETRIFQTQGKVSESRERLRQAQEFFEPSSTTNKSLSTGKEAVTTYSSTVNEPISLSGKDAKKLKRVLYQNLISDGIIDMRWDNVRMLIPARSINVNGESLSGRMLDKYNSILKRFDVSKGTGHKILMNEDFILIGKFTNERFDGTALGRMNSENIIGSILEEDFENLTLFNNEKHDNTALKSLINGKNHIDPEHNDFTELATEERDISQFDRIETKGVAVVYLTHGPHTKAKLKVRGMPISDVTTKVVNGQLQVDTKGTPQGESIEVMVSSENIREIAIRGASELYSENQISADRLKIYSEYAGAGWIDINTEEVIVNLRGGDLELSGRTKVMDVNHLQDAELGTFNYNKLEIDGDKVTTPLKRIKREKLQELREDLISYLGSDGFIKYEDENIIVEFSNSGLKANGRTISDNSLIYYRRMLVKYGITLRDDRKIFIKGKKIVIADLDDGEFRFAVDTGGATLTFSKNKSWKSIEEEVFRDN